MAFPFRLIRMYSSRTRVLISYKKHLQDILRSGVLGSHSALLEINELVPLKDNTHIEVRCSLPLLGSTQRENIEPASLTHQVEQFVNSHASGLRSCLLKEYTRLKMPTFHFTIVLDFGELSFGESSAYHNETASTLNPPEKQMDIWPTIVKPTTVYGLSHQELMRKVTSGLSVKKQAKIELFTQTHDSEFALRSSSFDDRTSSVWAKVWKQRQDWRVQAKRERKHMRQNHGLLYLDETTSGIPAFDDNSNS